MSEPLISAKKVNEILLDCIFDTSSFGGEEAKCYHIEAITDMFIIDAEKIKQYKSKIVKMLYNLPAEFQEESGGGYSFLNMPTDKNGELWGGQKSAEELYVLGAAIGRCGFLMPRELWNALPGGVPYIAVYKQEKPLKPVKVKNDYNYLYSLARLYHLDPHTHQDLLKEIHEFTTVENVYKADTRSVDSLERFSQKLKDFIKSERYQTMDRAARHYFETSVFEIARKMFIKYLGLD